MVRTALLWSVKAAGVRGCAKGEDLPGAGAGNSCDQGRSQAVAARGLNSSGIRSVLDFNFQLEDFVCSLLPFWIHPKISSMKSSKISISGLFGC